MLISKKKEKDNAWVGADVPAADRDQVTCI
jgi:hypothetical protein